MEIPLDEDDWRFHRSFTVEELEEEEEAHAFFHEFGFIIVRDAVSKDECENLVHDMWDFLQQNNPKLYQADDLSSTWKNHRSSSFGLTRFGMPVGVRGGMFRPQLLRLRQNENIYRAYCKLLNTNDIVCNHDRWLLHLPQELVQRKGLRNVHLDLNPHEFDDENAKNEVYKRLSNLSYTRNQDFISENNDVHQDMGLCLQGIVNLRDLTMDRPSGGGTIVVPGSHVSGGWPNIMDSERITGPRQYTFRNEKTLDLAQRVCLRAGSLLIWNQRLIHGSTPNVSEANIRAAIPLRFFPSRLMTFERAENRAHTILRQMRKVGFKEVNAVGRVVFGFQHLQDTRDLYLDLKDVQGDNKRSGRDS